MNLMKRIIYLIIIILLIHQNIFANNLEDIITTSLEGTLYSIPQTPQEIFNYFFKNELRFSAESNISEDIKIRNNIVIIVFSAILFIYWLFLLFKYEKERKYNYTYIDEQELLKKYNPLIAGCIADNRDILSRDIVAVLLNMINRQIIDLKLVPTNSINKPYKYELSRNRENEYRMDTIEKSVHNIFFDIIWGSDKIDLEEQLKIIKKDKEFYKKIDKLNIVAKKELNNIKANKNKVPIELRFFNFFVLFLSIAICVVHIANNGLNIKVYDSTILIGMFVITFLITIIPVIALFFHIIMYFMARTRRIINILNEKLTGQKIVATSISVILTFIIIIILTLIFSYSKYLILDVILLGVSILLVRTDHLMQKNDEEILNDFYNLKRIKDKCKNSLMNERDIQDIKLWKEYLTHAIAFGIPIEIINRIKHTYIEDKDIVYLEKCELLYAICKSYLEIFWEMKFKKKESFKR